MAMTTMDKSFLIISTEIAKEFFNKLMGNLAILLLMLSFDHQAIGDDSM